MSDSSSDTGLDTGPITGLILKFLLAVFGLLLTPVWFAYKYGYKNIKPLWLYLLGKIQVLTVIALLTWILVLIGSVALNAAGILSLTAEDSDFVMDIGLAVVGSLSFLLIVLAIPVVISRALDRKAAEQTRKDELEAVLDKYRW
jgi:hypothetical protein